MMNLDINDLLDIYWGSEEGVIGMDCGEEAVHGVLDDDIGGGLWINGITGCSMLYPFYIVSGTY